MGDPGLFGFLGDAVKTVAGFIPGGSTVISAAERLLGGGSAPRTAAPSVTGVTKLSSPWSTPGITQQQVPVINPPFGGPPGVGVNLGPIQTGIGQGLQYPQQMNGNGGKAPSGYHWNKSDYFLKSGQFVPKGSKLVKNRRRNPLNPRAMSRAISRLEMGKRAADRLDRVKIKCKRCGYTSCRCKG